MTPIGWAILLLLLALALLAMEMFIPSGGLISLLACIALIASVSTVFIYKGTSLGMAYLVTLAVLLPATAGAAVRWWPHTPIGRRILNIPPGGQTEPPASGLNAGYRELLGKHGTAKTTMLPSGAIVIDGRTYDAVSEGQPIDAGQAVEVVDVQSFRIVVTAVESPQRDAAEPSAPSTGETLDQVIPDPFDDSLA